MSQDTLLCAKPFYTDTISGVSLESVSIHKSSQYQSFPSEFIFTSKKIDSTLKEKKQVESIFKTHLLKADNINTINYPIQHKDWITIILLLITLIFIWVKASHSKRLKQITDGLYAIRYISQQSREGWIFSHNGSFEMFSVFILSISMLAFLIIEENGIYLSNWVLFAKIAGIVTGVYIFKFLAIKFIGTILNIKRELNEYITQVFLLNEFLGMTFLPIVILMVYVEFLKNPFTIISLIILSLVYIFRIFRGVLIISSYSKFSKFYLFLYFCSLEVLPMLIFVKILTTILD